MFDPLGGAVKNRRYDINSVTIAVTVTETQHFVSASVITNDNIHSWKISTAPGNTAAFSAPGALRLTEGQHSLVKFHF